MEKIKTKSTIISKSYSSVLRNLQKNMNGDGIEWFSNDKRYSWSLKEKKLKQRKPLLSTLFVLQKSKAIKT
jgi:hypothetical protein